MFEEMLEALHNPFGSSTAPAAPPTDAPAGTGHEVDQSGGSPVSPAAANPAAAAHMFGGLFDFGEPGMKEVVKDGREAIRDYLNVEQAKDDLKGKFKIGDETGPNAVSQEEFDKIAKLYSDIRAGNSDIKFDTRGMTPEKAAELKKKALDDMGTMLTTPAGRKLLGELADNESVDPNDPTKTLHHRTTLRLTDSAFEENDCDAKGMAAARAARDKAAGDEIEKRSTTPGVGNDAEVTIHPGLTKTLDGPGVESTGDTALFHELVHAHHITHGTKIHSSQVVTDEGRDQGQNMEEWATVGLGRFANDELTENEYRRQRMDLDPSVQERPSYH